MRNYFYFIKFCLPFFLLAAMLQIAPAQGELTITRDLVVVGNTKPIPVSLDGFSDDIAKILRFDLYVQGFSFVAPDAAQYQISGSSAGSVTGTVTDKFAKRVVLSRSYTGTSLRRQAHAFADDIVFAVTGRKGIALTKIAFKSQAENGNGEIYVSDFDGFGPQAITHDAAIVASPTWVPGKLALCYNSYKLGNPDIFFHDLTTGQRSTIARYGGSNISPAVSPDGKKVAMVLSKGGNPDIYVADLDGSNLKQLTHATEDESSPCWSPDGQWICFAAKIRGRRALAKISVNGGDLQRIPTVGILSPTEPDWSPDGKWIAFTAQMGEFDICVVPADGGNATVLVPGERPSWSPNSRTLIFNHSVGYHGVLSVLDVFTKQVKDIGRISGSNSEAAWQR